MSRINIYSTPRQEVVIYPFIERVPSSQGKLLDVKRVVVTDSVEEVSYNKTKISPSGNFSITLYPTKDWDMIFRPGDWLTIHLSQINLNPNTTKGLLCLGNIDRVSRSFTIDSDGKRTVRYRIEGRDFGKILEETKFYYNPYVRNTQQAIQSIIQASIGTIKFGSPVDLFRSYFNVYFGDGSSLQDKSRKRQKLQELDQVLIPPKILKIFGINSPEGKFADLVRLKIGEQVYRFEDIIDQPLDDRHDDKKKRFLPEGYTFNLALDLVVNNNLWEVLRTVCNLTMNELYTSMEYYPEEDKVIPTIVFRKIPFRKDLYTDLLSVKIGDHTIQAEDLGFSDHERINYVQLDSRSRLHGGYQSILALNKTTSIFEGFTYTTPGGDPGEGVPYVDNASIKRYGYRPYQQETSFCFQKNESGDGVQNDTALPALEIYKRWQRELIEVWANLDRFQSGTLQLEGFSRVEYQSDSGKKKVITDSISIGQNAHLYGKDKLFHIEGLSKTWKIDNNGGLTMDIYLTLSRGVYYKKGSTFKFLDEQFTDKQSSQVTQNRLRTKKE